MRRVQMAGICILFLSLNLVFAQAVGIPRKEDVPKYLRQLQNSVIAAERVKAADMLGKRGGINFTDVEDAVEPLKTMMKKDSSADARAAAVRAIGNIHPEATDTVPLLVDRLKNDSAMVVKMASVVSLGQYGPDAKEAVPALRDLATKFDAKKSKDGQTIQATLKLINGSKKKKN